MSCNITRSPRSQVCVTNENTPGVRLNSPRESGGNSDAIHRAKLRSAALAEVQSRLSENEQSSHQARQACASPREALPAPQTPTTTPMSTAAPVPQNETETSYAQEAQRFPDLRNDPIRIEDYVEARSIGATVEQARAMCKYGKYFLHQTDLEREQTRALLKRYGEPDAPLVWPRARLQLKGQLEDLPVLGKGRCNTVYAIKVDGVEYAFRPLAEKNPKDKGKAVSPISGAGQLLGLVAKHFYPALRSMAACRVADAMGLMGEHGLVDKQEVVIVNDVPGLLSRRIQGAIEGRGNLWQVPVEDSSPVFNYICASVRGTRNPQQAHEKIHSIGLMHIDPHPQGVCLTGTRGKRNLHALNRYSSPGYNLKAACASVLGRALNLSDLHSGNVMYECLGPDAWALWMIDLEEAFAPINPEKVRARNDHERASLTSTCPQPELIPALVRNALNSTRCQEMLAAVVRELRLYLPAADLENFVANVKALRESTAPGWSSLEVWKPGTPLRPHANRLHHWIGFSTNQDWDSDDSDSGDDCPVPEAEYV